MRGPYLLRPLQVDISVPERVGGIYCLAKNPRQIAVVARVERNLKDAIKAHWKEYEFFWYEPALSPKEAYVNQCYIFHRCLEQGTLEIKDHPHPPEKVETKCPICGV